MELLPMSKPAQAHNRMIAMSAMQSARMYKSQPHVIKTRHRQNVSWRLIRAQFVQPSTPRISKTPPRNVFATSTSPTCFQIRNVSLMPPTPPPILPLALTVSNPSASQLETSSMKLKTLSIRREMGNAFPMRILPLWV